MKTQNGKTRSGLIRLALAMIIAFIFLSLFSKNSFLYPMNDWVDEHCFFTVGRAVTEGKVIYRDICEQKGPAVYFAFALAALISKTSFLGVFLLEWLLFSAFLYTAGGFLTLYRPSSGPRAIAAAMLLTAFCVTASISFSHGGSVEELSLFPLSLSLLQVLRAVQRGDGVKSGRAALVGAFAATAFWSKFTMAGFFLGLCAAYAAIELKRGAASGLIKAALAFISGAAAATLPVLAYFALNGAISDLFQTYFYYNIGLYPQNEPGAAGFFAPLVNVIKGAGAGMGVNWPCTLLLAIGAFALLRGKGRLLRHRRELAVICACITALAAFTFIGGRSYLSYYALIFDCFAPLGAAAAIGLLGELRFFKRLASGARTALTAALAALLAALGLLLNNNTYLLKYKKADMPQYRFAGIMNEKPGATLLNYGFLDGGFYFASGISPSCKYFCELNLDLSEMKAEQRRMVERREVDFVVTRGRKLEAGGVDCAGYELCAEAAFPFEGKTFVYYLYRLK